MKKGLLIVVLGLLGIGFSSLSAQLLIGPAIQAGMTYSKNTIIEDTSRYHIGNSPSLFGAAGFDFAYQFDKNVRVQAGIQGQYRSFNLTAPEGIEGLSFTNIKQSAIVISVPCIWSTNCNPFSQPSLIFHVVTPLVMACFGKVSCTLSQWPRLESAL